MQNSNHPGCTGLGKLLGHNMQPKQVTYPSGTKITVAEECTRCGFTIDYGYQWKRVERHEQLCKELAITEARIETLRA